MPRIVDARSREFLDKGTIELFTMEELDKGLRIAGNSKYGKQARAYLIASYYTGSRPVEQLQLKPTNFEKKKKYLTIQVPTAKRGVPRVISIPFARKHVTELWNFITSLPEDVYVFYDLISHRTRDYATKRGVIKRYVIITDRIYYYIKKWIGVNPYFLRHSRISSLSQNGANMNELMQFKGTNNMEGIRPYMHMSSQMSQKIGRRLK